MIEQQMEGQMSIFDLDIWSGKTCQAPCQVQAEKTKAKTSGRSLRKSQGSSRKIPLYLDLRGDGHTQDALWETGGVLLGVYMMHSFGESPKDVRESRLSQILEDRPHPKYTWSSRACQGILNRAERRGKELPPQLREALIRQSASKNEQENQGGVKDFSSNMNAPEPYPHSTTSQCLNSWDVQSKHIQPEEGKAESLYSGECRYGGGESYVMQKKIYGISSYDSNAMKSPNPHSGIYEADTTRTLDNNGGNPACNQGGMVVLEGNGARESHKGDGYKESDTMYTLNTIEHHAVCVSQDAYDKYSESEKAATIKQSGGIYGGQ